MAEDKDKSKVDDTPGKPGEGKDVTVDPKIADLMKDPDKLKELIHERSRFLGESQKYLAELNKLEKAKKDAEDAALVDQGKFKEIAEKHKMEADDLRRKFSEQRLDFELRFEAQKAGIIDPGDAIRLCDRAGLKLSEDFTTVEGAKEAVEVMKKVKPYLFTEDDPKIPPPDIKRASLKKGITSDDGSVHGADRIAAGLAKQKK